MKSALTAIIGRPSSGKSTLLNTISGYKVSIVSPIPQTTRNRIRGILTEPRGQLVFLDTPGFNRSEKKINLRMMDLVKESLSEADIILYVVDATKPPGEEEQILLSMVTSFENRTLAAINKSDAAGPAQIGVYRALLSAILPATSIFEISALEDKGVSELITALFEKAPEGPSYYPDDFYTDQDPSFRISEIIREQVFRRMKEEIPHSVFVEIADLEERDGGEKLWVRAFIHVERDSQKGILIGRNGSIIRDIRVTAEKELGEIFPQYIHLDLRVKVTPKWRQSEKLLGKLIR